MTRLGLSMRRARKGMAWVSSKVTRVYSRDGHIRTAAMARLSVLAAAALAGVSRAVRWMPPAVRALAGAALADAVRVVAVLPDAAAFGVEARAGALPGRDGWPTRMGAEA